MRLSNTTIFSLKKCLKECLLLLPQLLKEHEKEEAQVEEVTGQMEGKAGKPLAKASRQVGKNPRKNNTKKANEADTVVKSVASVSTTAETGHVSKVAKPKGRGALKKAPARKVCLQILKLLISQKMPTVADSEEEDDEVLELKERLAAYNIDSP
ncbi:DNA topoisomerase 2-like [Magnolia sinica]|uniref:DNA topoisomerase 2-like n=1 Tax=Magnolia sinica TaxID=86752 RepID=UPI00265A4291|nr:DNA topoisomerase 2-like [Magnolia sinica]